jgi:hypothetical protein
MGTTQRSMLYSLVLMYQLDMWGGCNGRTAGMCGEAAMAEPWEGVGKAVMAETHNAQEAASGEV